MSDSMRITVPWHPHYIAHRAVEGLPLFSCAGDYLTYIFLMSEEITKHAVDLWCWCLLPDHILLVGIPRRTTSLTGAIGTGHRRYSRRINHCRKRQGPLWRGRFSSFPMDETWALEAIRYVETRPVSAGLVENAEAYPWSSAQAHLIGNPDLLSRSLEVLDKVEQWQSLLQTVPEQDLDCFGKHEKSGRPLGQPGFVDKLKQSADHDMHFPAAAWRRDNRPEDDRGCIYVRRWSDD